MHELHVGGFLSYLTLRDVDTGESMGRLDTANGHLKARDIRNVSISLFVITLLLISSIPAYADAPASGDNVSTYIVVFNDTPAALSAASAQSVSAFAASYGGNVKYQYDIINGMAITIPDSEAARLSGLPNVKYIEKDKECSILLDQSIPQIGVDQVWLQGYNGSGIKVAVIDTGIDAGHPDLNGSKVIGWADFVNGRIIPYDDYGHGTHVSGIIAGTGNISAGKYTGVAPDANLIEVKVLDNTGNGKYSNVIAGINWAVNNGADVISMSLGGPHDQSMDEAVNNAISRGVVVVIAAGNSGPYSGSIECPGDTPAAITVGAVNKTTDVLASFSSRGPNRDGSIKPDVVNAGVSIISARAWNTHPKNSIPIDDYYTTMSGTSMATPMTAGVVALMLQKNPLLTPSQVKSLLKISAKPLGSGQPNNQYGWGRVSAINSIDHASYSWIQLNSTGYSVDEDGNTVYVNVTRSYNDTDTAGFTLTTIPGTATSPPDYDTITQSFTFAHGEMSRLIPITINDDNLYSKTNKQFSVRLSDPVDALLDINQTAVITLNEKDPAPYIELNNTTYYTQEDSGSIAINVTRHNDAWDDVTIDYSTSDGTALQGLNYGNTTGTLTFRQGEMWHIVNVPVYRDHLYSDPLTFTFRINGMAILVEDPPHLPPPHLDPLNLSATVTISSVDPAPIVRFASPEYTVGHNNASVNIVVTRLNDAIAPVAVQYNTSDGTAIAGLNYTDTNGILTFNKGEMSHIIMVPLIGSQMVNVENTTFNITLSNPIGEATIGIPNKTTVAISNITVSFTYSFKKGWNLISIPVVPNDNNLSVFFPADVMSNIAIVWEYNSSNTSSPWSYYTTMTDKYKQGTLSSVNERQGYWVRCYNDMNFTVTGYTPKTGNVTLNSGWNLIGNPAMEVRQPWATYTDAKIMWEYNSSNTSSPWSYYTTMTDKYKQGSLTEMKPGHGYWVRI